MAATIPLAEAAPARPPPPLLLDEPLNSPFPTDDAAPEAAASCGSAVPLFTTEVTPAATAAAAAWLSKARGSSSDELEPQEALPPSLRDPAVEGLFLALTVVGDMTGSGTCSWSSEGALAMIVASRSVSGASSIGLESGGGSGSGIPPALRVLRLEWKTLPPP